MMLTTGLVMFIVGLLIAVVGILMFIGRMDQNGAGGALWGASPGQGMAIPLVLLVIGGATDLLAIVLTVVGCIC